ncbi:MAG: hypothetical protein KR126chlam1_01405 [Chlamydiae bacterium]|nr:hypothetical protein [Chlamydiota bacterium]
MRKTISTEEGSPSPLGVTQTEKGTNFALYSAHATSVSLGIFLQKSDAPQIIPINKKTADIWHILLKDLPETFSYAYRLTGPSPHFQEETWIIDPHAKELTTSPPLGKVSPPFPFDWENISSPNHHFEELIIYEMHLRGFTKDSSSQTSHPGTFLGMIEKIPYLKELGINAVELLPIFAFDETANPFQNPTTKEKLTDYWGYSPFNFFTPMNHYASDPNQAIHECKQLVKALHKENIEIILDVVFNHTGAYFRGIDNPTYFLQGPKGEDTNYTGCGNTLNCNHPATINLILSALRYWAEEMHIDGFRFDLASIFCRGENGEILKNPPLIEAITSDPILSRLKLIAEPWDCAGLYQLGSFPAKDWAEWNGAFRDNLRRFIKGSDGALAPFATLMSGSAPLFPNKSPYHSINFVTAHDGFTLRDLVSYNEKHNLSNGEENRDGNNSNESWNCGVEGPTDDPQIELLRQRQMRNFLLALTMASGTPMFLMGDEYGHTRQGNNNSYSQDNELNHFLWNQLEEYKGLHRFFKKLIHLRKNTPLLHRKDFLSDSEIIWHDARGETPDWSQESRFLAYTLIDPQNKKDLYLAFNAGPEEIRITLPSDKQWRRLIDTSLPSPEDFKETGPSLERTYRLPSHSALLLTS